MPRALHVLTGTCLLALVTVAAAPPSLLPVDEAASRPEFFSFRAQLQRALAAHDAAALLAIVDRNIKNSFGGNDGIDEFKTMWGIDRPDSPVWTELGTVLALGGSFSDAHTFVAPYVFSRWPDDLDSFEHVAVIGSRVRVRAAPRADAPALDSVSFAILAVPRRATDTAEGWTAVQLDNKIGFIASSLVRSPIGYRAIFSDASGQWRLVTFVAGD